MKKKQKQTNCLSRRFQKIEFIGNLNVAIHFQWGVGNTKKVHQSYAQLTKRVFKSNHYDLYKQVCIELMAIIHAHYFNISLRRHRRGLTSFHEQSLSFA